MSSREIYSNRVIRIEEHVPTGFTVVRTTDAVAVLILVKNKGVLLVKQNRPPMISEENPMGTIIETVAGRFDVNLSPIQLAVKEIKEEVGGTINENQILLLNDGVPLAISPGVFTEKVYLAYAEIYEDQLELNERIFGQPEEGEQIQRMFIPIENLKQMIFHDMKTFALVQWFLREYEAGRFVQ